MKHAYNIIAHANLYVLNKLICSIDDPRNDIFIHLDPKSIINKEDIVVPKKSSIHIFTQISVYWGHVSLMEVELFLYEQAHKHGPYSYYHILSGADLPIKDQDTIHDFFKFNEGKEFIGFSDASLDMEKISKWHIFTKNMRVTEKQYLNRIKRKIRNVFISIQRLCKYNRVKNHDLEYKFGSAWTSLTQNLIEELITNKPYFMKLYKGASCVDEIFKHTFVYNSNYINKVYTLDDELTGCQRLIDWKRGNPYTFRMVDLELLQKSPLLFARKFDENIDGNIVDSICNNILDANAKVIN